MKGSCQRGSRSGSKGGQGVAKALVQVRLAAGHVGIFSLPKASSSGVRKNPGTNLPWDKAAFGSIISLNLCMEVSQYSKLEN